jgi:hypothetical protein
MIAVIALSLTQRPRPVFPRGVTQLGAAPFVQGVWLEMSLDGGGVKDELDGLGRVALVVLEPT